MNSRFLPIAALVGDAVYLAVTGGEPRPVLVAAMICISIYGAAEFIGDKIDSLKPSQEEER